MVKQVRFNTTLSTNGLVGTAYPKLAIGVSTQQLTTVLNTSSLDSVSIIVDPTSVSVGTQAFTYPGTGNVVIVGTNTFVTGQAVTLTTAGTLPTGVGTGTTYFVIPSGTTLSLASSLANAQGGTAITLSGTSTNTGTVNPTALSATVQQQVQNGSSSWVSLGTAQTVTSGTANVLENDVAAYEKTRVQVIVTAGQLNLNVSPCGKISYN